MYGFVDTIPGSAESTSLSLQTILDGITLDDALTDENGSFITLTVSGRSNTVIKRSIIPVPGMHGAWENEQGYLEPRLITVKFKIKDKTSEGMRKRLQKLNALIGGSKRVLSFTDEESIFHASLQELDIPEEESNDLVGYLYFICTDPFKYGPEKTLHFPADIVEVENEGTAETEPIFELTAKQKTTFAMVSNGGDEDAEYNLIGKPVDVDEKLVDEKTNIFTERGKTLSDWYEPSGNWSGSFTTTGDAIVINSWGTGAGWHGPALMREITPAEDYEVEMYVYTRTEQPNQTFRISTNLYDENMNELGMVRLWDKTTNQIRKVAEGRLGRYIENYLNYLISDRNYNLRGQRVWGGIIRIRKEGNRFTFYVARVTQGGRHTATLTESFVDQDNEYAGKLKFIRFDMTTFGDTGTPNEIRIEYIKATKLEKVKVDETPYILYPDDVVTFDHKDEDLLINGEPRNDLKDFGGSFFKLKKGKNMLIVSPIDTFETRLRFRDKYL